MGSPALAMAVLQSSFIPAQTGRSTYTETYDQHISSLKYGLGKWPHVERSQDGGCKTADCCLLDFQVFTEFSPGALLPEFEALARVGQALLTKVRSEYNTDTEIFKNLISFNDRYPGVEAFERAYAVYRQAAENDDVAEMIRERSTFLGELAVAEDRKKLLTQQSAQIGNYRQRLSDIAASVQHDDLVAFVDPQTQDAIDKLHTELEQLSQIAPAKRGDIAANLETLETRIDNIDTEIKSAKTAKREAEDTKHTLVENEGAATRILQSATSPDLRSAFDDQFAKSVNELIDRIRDLETISLSAIRVMLIG